MKRFYAIMLSFILVLSFAPLSYADRAAKPEENAISKIITVGYEMDKGTELFGTADVKEIDTILHTICEELMQMDEQVIEDAILNYRQQGYIISVNCRQ